MSRVPQVGDFYCHFKNKLYQIKAVAIHSETRESLVIYQALYGSYLTYARPLDMFVSEVDHEKYPEVKQRYRFTKVIFHEDGSFSYPEEDKNFIGPNASKAVAVVTEAAKVPEVEKMSEAVKISETVESIETDWDDAGLDGVHPGLMAFLDTEDFDEKYNILVSLRDVITDEMIDAMSVSIDSVIKEGDLTKRYDELKSVLRTRQKYEFANRLR